MPPITRNFAEIAMSERLPLQLQLREYGPVKKDYWIVLPKTPNPSQFPNALAPVIAVPQNKFDKFRFCDFFRIR